MEQSSTEFTVLRSSLIQFSYGVCLEWSLLRGRSLAWEEEQLSRWLTRERSRDVMTEQANKTEVELPVTSSVPYQLPPKQRELFRQVLTLFEEKNVPYAVSGAFALQLHTGICRFTKDLDIFLTAPSVPGALAHLEGSGFASEICDPVWLAKVHRDDYFVDLITGMSNGVIRVDDSWIERSYPVTIFGVPTRALAPEELVASKLFVTRRERFDGADIAHVIYASRGNLHWDRVLELAGEHWQMVLWALVLFGYVYPAQARYVPAWLWEDLFSRFAQAVHAPDPRAKFRGSLIDDKMFAIDVEEWGLPDVLKECRAKGGIIDSLPSSHTA